MRTTKLQVKGFKHSYVWQTCMTLLVICTLIAAIPAQAANIVWVSFHPGDETPSATAGGLGFTNAPDVGYTRLLRSAGHNVTRVVTMANAAMDTNLLNSADLVIIGRSVPSDHYQDPPERAFWHGIVSTPVMIMGGYINRTNRLGFMTGNTIPDVNSNPVRLTVLNPSHPIFAGVSLDSANLMVNPYANIATHTNFPQRGISVVTDPPAGGPTVLARVGTPGDAALGGLVIAEWPAGAVISGETLAGRRLVFLSGSREHNGLNSQGSGIYDLAPEGARMFLNAVNYMAPPDAGYAATILSQSPIVYYRFNDPVTAPPPPDVATNSGSLGTAGNGVYVNCPAHPLPSALPQFQTGDASASFDGQSQSIDVPHSDVLNPFGLFTVEAWVRPTIFTNFNRTVLASRWIATGVQQGFQLIARNTGVFRFTTFNGTGGNNLDAPITPPVNEWTHVVATHDGSLNRLYVNGVLVATSGAVTYVPNSNPGGVFRIGGGLSENSGGDFWAGGLDEVAVYPAALSAADILAHYDNGTNAAPAQPYDQLVLAGAPVGYWRLNEPAGPPCNVAMNSGTRAGANANYFGGALPGSEAPRGPAFFGFEDTNTAVNLNGSNQLVASVSGLLNDMPRFTLSGWFRREGTQPNRTGLWGQNDKAEFGYITDVRLQAWTDNALNLDNPPYPNGQWAHVAVVSEGSPGVIRMYTNGIFAVSRNHTLPTNNLFRFNIGGGGVFDAARNFFFGQIDEVAVFDRSLTAEQIAAQYFSTVVQAPIITSQPQGTTNIFEGQTLTLTVRAVGSPPLRYQWKYFGTAIPGQTNATLVITNAATTDSGSYSVTVSNDHGSVDSEIVEVTVNANQPPQITQEPVSITRYAGATATFTVGATGSGDLRYQWQFNTVDISGATNATLVITNVQASNAGDYRAVVTNAFGTTTSATATLTVITPPTGSYAAAIMAANPMAFWPLNETNGTTAFDYAGGFDGTYNGGVTMGVEGVTTNDAAAQFDGTSGYVGTPFQLNQMSAVTAIGWIRRETNQLNRTGLWGQNDLAEFGYINDNTIEFWSGQAAQVSPNPIPNQQWGQVAFVRNGNAVTIYVNGSARTTAALSTGAFGSNAFRFNIAGGGIQDATGNFFNGRVDDLAVFSRALTAGEICSLYSTGLGGPLAVDIDRSGEFVLDTSGAATPHHGANLGASWMASNTDSALTTRTGVVAFAAAESDQIMVPAHADFNTTSGTITFWVRSAGTTGPGDFGAMLFDRRTDAAPGGRTGDVIVQTDAGNIFVQAASSGAHVNVFQTTRSINDDLWHHVAYVYDQSASGAITLYIDGVQDATQVNSAAWSWPPTQPIELGRSHDTFWRAFNGLMDDVRVYNTMLTATDIAAIVAGDAGSPVAASSMVLRLNFDGVTSGVTLNWPCGVLQEANALVGDGSGTQWNDVAGATPPYSILPQGQMKFFRVRQ